MNLYGPMRVFVTGAAEFIGSNFVDRLLGQGHTVIRSTISPLAGTSSFPRH